MKMNWYKISQFREKTVEQVEQWVNNYVQNNGGPKNVTYGKCEDFVEALTDYLKDDLAEIWSLWSVFDEYEKQLPFINENTSACTGLGIMYLTDIGFEHHIVVKWRGFWWDGYGKQNINQIMEHFNKVQNPKWFNL